MELTPGQLSAARACGCALTPATDDQVRRLGMQRRIFLVRGKPFVAVRDGFLETHGTLAKLIGKHRPAEPDRSDDPETAPTPAQAVAPDMESPASIIGVSAGAGARRQDDGAAFAKPRKPRPPRPKPPPTPAKSAVSATNTAQAPNTEKATAELGATPTRAPRARGVGRRAGQPPMPRWMTAGKVRRGRLK